MNCRTSIAIIKARELLGRISEHGIQASRATRTAAAHDGPDAFLVAADGRAWLASFWNGESAQPSLLADQSTIPLDVAAAELANWSRRLAPETYCEQPALLLIAPALPTKEVPATPVKVGSCSVSIVGQQDCRRPSMLAAAVLRCSAPFLKSSAIAQWRVSAVPEVGIHQAWTRKQVKREANQPIAPLLLDYKQERCARLDLEPDLQAEDMARKLQLRIVTGVAGCGKTLVLVHRAALLARHFPKARVLMISFNRALVNDLKGRIARRGGASNIECMTFHQWLSKGSRAHDMMSPSEMRRWIEKHREPFETLRSFSSDWIRDELHWMCDHEQTGESYLQVERKGRGTRLSKRQRVEMQELLHSYRVYLEKSKRSDWSEWPLQVLERAGDSPGSRLFDHLLIDEAQFFAPVWLKLLQLALKPGGHLFLCADQTQGFLHRRQSWVQVGLDARNRSHRLERPYRCSAAILGFAREFYKRRMPDDDEPLNLPSEKWFETLEPGAPPVIIDSGSLHDQLSSLETELRSLEQAGVPKHHVLILVAGHNFNDERLVEHLTRKLGQGSARLMKSDKDTEGIGVANLMAATGLECPIVIILGLDELVAEEANPILTPEEAAERRLTTTRQIYMGLTRAMERLVVYASHDRLRTAFGL